MQVLHYSVILISLKIVNYITYSSCHYYINLFQVGIRSITNDVREQVKKYGVETHEMRTLSRDRPILENLVSPHLYPTLFSNVTFLL